MKYILFFLCLAPGIISFAQESNNSERDAVKQTIQLFFDSIEQQDSVLLKQVAMEDGQVWTVNNLSGTPSHRMRYFRDDVQSLQSESDMKEIPYDMEINIHKGLAIAWVPYAFHINDEFSHCGVDIFTLINTSGKWKITTISYTLDRDGCSELKATTR